MAEPTIDERVKRIEQLLERAIETARQSAVGRNILARLGIR